MSVENFDYPDGTTSIPDTTVWDGGDFVVQGGRLGTATDSPDGILVYDSKADGIFQATFYPNSPSDIFKNMALIFRAIDTSNKWVFRINAEEPAPIRIQKLTGGVSTLVHEEDADASITENEPRTLKVEALGDSLKFYLNGYLIFSTNDSTHNTETKAGVRLDNSAFEADNFIYPAASDPAALPRPTYTQAGRALTATNLGKFFDTLPPILADGGEEFWPYAVNMEGVNNWPSVKYPVALYTSTDHSAGTAGVYLRVYNSELGDIENPSSWEVWDDVSGRAEFSHITQKNNPIFNDASYSQTETPTVKLLGGTVYMFYHVNNYDGGFGRTVQATCLATGTNGVDFTVSNRGILAYNPFEEQGDGHTGYFTVVDNPISEQPYTYLGASLYGGGTLQRAATTAVWGSNDLVSWTLIKTIGWNRGNFREYVTDKYNNCILRAFKMDSIKKEGAYYRIVMPMREEIAPNWTPADGNQPWTASEVLIDSEFNVVGAPNVLVDLVDGTDYAHELEWGGLFEYNGKQYSFCKFADDSDVGSTGLLRLEESAHNWTVMRSLSTPTVVNEYGLTNYNTLTASANTTLSDDGDTVNFTLPSDSSFAYVYGSAITLDSYDVIDIQFTRHGKVTNDDIRGLAGFVNALPAITDGVLASWPRFSDNTQSIKVQVLDSGVAAEFYTNKWVGVGDLGGLSAGFEEGRSRQNYGIRIAPKERIGWLLDGNAPVTQFSLEGFDTSQSVVPTIRMKQEGVTQRDIDFESIKIITYLDDQIAQPDTPVLTATPQNSAIDVSTTPATGATGYKAFYGQNGVYQEQDLGASTSGTISGLTNGESYDVYMRSYDADGVESEPTTEQGVTPSAADVPEEDTTKPIITLIGSSSITIPEGDSYVDAGATASDNVDGDISGDIIVSGSVDTSTPATYVISYNVSDAAGNQADEVTRTVTVEAASNDAPISLISPVADRSAFIDSAFSYDLTAFFDGTFTPFTYALTGTLPDGLTFNAATATISGTATAEETAALTITATDANSNEVSDAFVITTKTLIPSVNIGATGLIRPTLRETLRS